MKKPPQKRKNYGTLAEFADAAAKTPLKTLAGWVQRPDWPFERKAPWPLERAHEALKWAANNLQRGRHGKDLDQDAEERDRLDKKKRRLEVGTMRVKFCQAKAEYALKLGQLVPIADVEAAWAQIAVTVRNAVENIPSQIVPLAITCGMPHEAAARLQNEIESLIASVLRHLSANETKIGSRGISRGRAGADGKSEPGGEEIPGASVPARAVESE